MIATIASGPLERQLIICIQHATTGMVATQHGVFCRTDDKLVTSVVTATTKYGALHLCQHLTFTNARLRCGKCGIQCIIRKLRCPLNTGDLRRAFYKPELVDQSRRISQCAERLQRRF